MGEARLEGRTSEHEADGYLTALTSDLLGHDLRNFVSRCTRPRMKDVGGLNFMSL